MILTVAEGSSGHYMIDEQGRIHTRRGFMLDPAGIHGPKPGERPPPFPYRNAIGGCYSAYAGGPPTVHHFWFPTGQVEELGPDQRDELEFARQVRDLQYEAADASARVIEAWGDRMTEVWNAFDERIREVLG